MVFFDEVPGLQSMNIIARLGQLWLIGLFLLPGAVSATSLEQQRTDFLLAERLIASGNEEGFLEISAGLPDYPLYPYLRYQWLKDNLQQTDNILSFLSTYKETRYAGLLRAKWLDYLAKQERWYEFSQYYQVSEDTALECQFYWANYKSGNTVPVFNAVKRLWTSGDSLPKECDPLLSVLTLSPDLTPELVWQRFESALRKGHVHLAEYARRFLSKPEQLIADSWLQVHKKPALIQASDFRIGDDKRTGQIFAHGVDRMAGSDLDLALVIWDSRKQYFSIDTQTAQYLERKFALALARKQDYRAYNRLDQLLNVDEEVREWKIRTALYEQNWPHIAHALAGLTVEEQADPKWQYWQARSLVETGNSLQALAVYNKLAEDRSFYGFLAADTVNKPYQSLNKPVFLAGNELEALAGETDFKVVQEFKYWNRDIEARRQWWFAVGKLGKERLMIAAKLAQQWQWDQVAIMTLVKADYWDDLDLRFPVSYLTQVQANASLQDLDPSIVFGLMRQESMLDKNAMSAAGARGLMQVMPKTGQQIAQHLNESWQSENSLFNPETNIKYGTYYYKQLLSRFNGHVALATAAYNAGPNRVAKWLPSLKAVPADIWIETIPFKETRKYVIAVLSYAMIYQQRTQRNTLKIKNLLLDVQPG